MWNLAEPGARFPAAAPNHPEIYLAKPQAFQAFEKKYYAYSYSHAPFPCPSIWTHCGWKERVTTRLPNKDA